MHRKQALNMVIVAAVALLPLVTEPIVRFFVPVGLAKANLPTPEQTPPMPDATVVRQVYDIWDIEEYLRSSGLPVTWATEIVVSAHAENLSPWLVVAVMQVESRGDPGAVGKAGELGLMQLAAPTAWECAKELGLSPVTINPQAPAVNIRLGAHYLGKMARRFTDPDVAVAAYNGGPGGWDTPAATRYAQKVWDLKMSLERRWMDSGRRPATAAS